MYNSRIAVFTGHFGSGKTEVAINYAFNLAGMGRKTIIADLDTVNPFFRTADVKSLLEEKGIRVIVSQYANTNVDVPALPPELYSLFDDKSYWAVLDVGGDDLGARALSRFKQEVLGDEYTHYFVINTRRPMTKNADEIILMIEEIQKSSGLAVDRLVNNSNLLDAGSADIIAESSGIIREVSARLSIPIGFISGMRGVLMAYRGDSGVERLYMEKHIRLPWL